ncbi:MAG: TIM barrel protein [Rhodothermaceae bacterium]|nr:TIM barrel protein [Rhodothermaceae bacterium]MXX58619.1 TIM barrel protein [Rhodothermaceae bacterium]MXZ05039.1 TIM barrel protein [Rhodothermaceae bacterium]MYD19698.1 TIM barrel protein [Rhodothermaceae bacterium]MYD57037.1 TIM barrel protein [Rhodothermaceae bacterium]
MTRREFMPSAALMTAAASLGCAPLATEAENGVQDAFSMHYAPHFGMFKNSAGDDLVDQLNFAADQGFTAWEDNGMKGRNTDTQERIARTMSDRNMRMGVFVAHQIHWREPNLASGDADLRAQFLSDIEDSVEVAKRVNATWMTVVPGFVDLRLDMGYQTANVVESLRRACDILEPHGLVMVLEPLNPHNHPGLFLTKIPQAYSICRSVDSPACKILNDLYHQQITEGNLIPNIDGAWDEIGYFQIGDNPGRKEPTTGEINYANVFAHIRNKGFEGILGMEHGNMHPGKEGEVALIEAYRNVDGGGG